MSCNPTGPINIEATKTYCTKKCLFNYDFKKSSITAYNKKKYISIKLDNKNEIAATFSSTPTQLCSGGTTGRLTVEEIRIYTPSIHTYGSNGDKADGELLIIFNNTSGGRHLVMSIPILSTGGTLVNASSQLVPIINQLSRIGNSNGEGGIISGLNFNLNQFIPINKGFYKYSASLPWNSCEKCTDYIVYDKRDVSIGLGNMIISRLKQTIPDNPNISIQDSDLVKIGYAFNSKGAKRGFGNNDAIWINCYPTGSDGKILVDENKRNVLNNNQFGIYSGIDQHKFEKYKTIGMVILIILGIVFALLFFMYGFTKILGGNNKVSFSKTNKASANSLKK
tara:strand:+ start:130 stop:1140 length:1011 start_codon:yes stop_codon:yes gene_type:complete